MRQEWHRHQDQQEYLLRHLDQNLAGFHTRLRFHRHHGLGQHYHLFRLSLNRPIRYYHVGIHRLRLSDHRHRCQYLMHLEWHHYLDLLAYWLCRLDQNLIEFHIHLRCHRHHDQDRYYHLFRLSLNLPIRLHHEEMHQDYLSNHHHQYHNQRHQGFRHYQDLQAYYLHH